LNLRASSAAGAEAAADADDVVFGAMTCSACAVYYPIWNGVPRMLTYRTSVAEVHAQSDPAWLAENLNGFALPDRQPPLGELRILRSFSEVVGMDLGYAVDQAQRYFGQNRRLHIVQASVFAPPFRADSFDMVYSHGVLHHTYSTPTAFARLTQLPKARGGMLYIWVYSHAQEKATVLRRALMMIETAIRPAVSRMPSSLQTITLLPALPF